LNLILLINIKVQYKLTEDLDLGFHYDDSDITLNVCLGKTFTGGDLYFKGLLKDPSTHSEHFTFSHTPGNFFFQKFVICN